MVKTMDKIKDSKLTRKQVYLNNYQDMVRVIQKLSLRAAELRDEDDIEFHMYVESKLIKLALELSEHRKRTG